MRNIVEHPLEAVEIIDALTRAIAAEIASGRIGGIDAMALQVCASFCSTNLDELEGFVSEYFKELP